MCKIISFILSFYLVLIININIIAQGIDPGADNLTHSWTFNDGTTNDYVGGANGTLMGSALVINGSLLTIDPGSYMEMPGNFISMNTYDEVTIEAWFTSIANSNTGYHMLAYFGNTINQLGVNGYFITPARGDDKSRAAISCGVESSPWSGESGADGPELDDGELHHMVSTLTATDITLYIDGELKATTPLASNNKISEISPVHAYLSKSGYDGDSTWMGEIQEFNIFNKALSAEEILFLFNKGAKPTGVEDGFTSLPKEFKLLQNFPNPFNPSTKISFDIPGESMVKIKIYDILGREIIALLEEVKPAGHYTVKFDGTNLSNGVYIYKMNVNNQVFSRKMILLK